MVGILWLAGEQTIYRTWLTFCTSHEVNMACTPQVSQVTRTTHQTLGCLAPNPFFTFLVKETGRYHRMGTISYIVLRRAQPQSGTQQENRKIPRAALQQFWGWSFFLDSQHKVPLQSASLQHCFQREEPISLLRLRISLYTPSFTE